MSCKESYIAPLVNNSQRGYPQGVVVNMLDCDVVGIEFELSSCYYVHFRTNALENDMTPLISSAIG